MVDRVLDTAVAKGGEIDWIAVKTLCAYIHENPKAAKSVVNMLVHKIKEPGPAVGMADVCSLVLQALVKAGGSPVHKVVGKNKLLNELIRIISPKFGLRVPLQIRLSLLAAMISWGVCAEGGWANNVNPAVRTLAEAGVTVTPGYQMTPVRVPPGDNFKDIADPLEGAHTFIAQSISNAKGGVDAAPPVASGSLITLGFETGEGSVSAAAAAPAAGYSDLLDLSSGPALNPRVPPRAKVYEGEDFSAVFPNGPVMMCPPTFHEGYLLIGKTETETLLMRNKVGSYLVRESSTAEGNYALAVRDETAVQHFRIETGGGYLSITGSKNRFKQLDELVEFYRGPGRDSALPVQLTGTGIYGNYRMYKEPLHESRGYDFKADSYDVEDPSQTGAPKEMSETAFPETDEWEIERKDLSLLEVLGNGNYGEVHRSMLKVPWGGEIQVAVKMAKADRMTSRSFFNEAKKLKQLQHKHVVRVYGLCTTDNPIFIVFEFMPAGSLAEFLRSKKGRGITLLTQTRMACDIAKGMAFLEEQHWCHADLASRNCLVGDRNIVKICDFGHAIKMDGANTPVDNPVNLPIRWTAPEFFLDSKCSTASDVWSFGIVLFEILTRGETPYKEMDDPSTGFNNKTLMAMIQSGWRMQRHPKVPKYFYGIQLDCWQGDRSNRPTFRHLAQVLQTLCGADKLKEVAGNWGDGLVDSAGRPLPGYRSIGPRYKPTPWLDAKSDAAALLLEWMSERETTMKRRDREMMASLKGAGGRSGITAHA